MENKHVLIIHSTKIHELFLVFDKYDNEKSLKRAYFPKYFDIIL